jgi:hypothetical protein
VGQVARRQSSRTTAMRRELPRWAAIAIQRLGEFERAGLRVTAVRLDADQRDDLRDITGQAERMFGFPVRKRSDAT